MTKHTERKQQAIKAAMLMLAVTLSGAGQAALLDRGGGLIYDTVLNVTWLQDTNYAATSGVNTSGPNGTMIWSEAMTWANNLSYYDSVRGVTLSDWHLPIVTPVNGSYFRFATSIGGETDDSYNISAPGSAYEGTTASHLAYMYYQNLGNVARCPVTGWANCKDPYQPRVPALKVGPFLNMEGHYWTNSDKDLPYADALVLEFTGLQYGAQSALNAAVPRTAWAVRDGDVSAVPEPGTWAMFALALGLGAALTSKRRGRK